MAPRTRHRERYRSLAREETRRGLRTLFLVLPPTLVVLGVVHLLTLPAEAGLLNAGLAGVLALFFLMVRFGTLDREADPRWVVPTVALCIVLLVGSVGLLLLQVGQQVHVLYLALVLLGAGFFVLSVTAYSVAVGCVAVVFGFAWWVHGPSQEWLHSAIGLGTAAFLGAVSLSVRLRTVHWLADLRRRDEQQKTSMGRSLKMTMELETQARALAESAFEGIIIHRDGRVLDLNETACRIVGMPRAEAVRARLIDFLDGAELARYEEMTQAATPGQGETQESRWVMHDGRVVEVEARTRTIPYKGGQAEVIVVRDVTEERRAAREKAMIRKRLESILESAGEGVFGIDSEGRIVFANRAAVELCAVPGEQLIGQDAHALLHHTRRDGGRYPVEACPIMRAVHEGRVVEVSDEVFWRPDGSSYPVSYVASPLVEGEQVEGAVVVFQDDTVRAEVDRMKDELISVVGHELKTPLASVHASLRLIEGTKRDVPRDVARLVRIAARNTERLTRLVNDLLDVERMRAGRLALDRTNVKAQTLVEEAVGSVQAFASDHGVPVEQTGEDVSLSLDRDRVVQALVNLLSNAVKYSPRGCKVQVGVERRGSVVRFWVRDEGPGIPLEKHELLFQRFAQLDTSDAREKGGSGLGLVITRSIAEAHGGAAGLESTPGKGSIFFIDLPFNEDGADRVRGYTTGGRAA